jgi:hypothetical protein
MMLFGFGTLLLKASLISTRFLYLLLLFQAQKNPTQELYPE